MKILGIQFAPLLVPFHRRVETLAIFTVFFLIGLLFLLSMFVTVLLLLSPLYPAMILYIAWIIADRKTAEHGGRPIDCFRRWKLFHWARNYFPVSLTFEPGFKVDPEKNYLVCSFPHGVYPIGIFLALGHETPERLKLFSRHTFYNITLNIGFYIPFYRELLLGLGFCNAQQESIDYILRSSKGGNIVAVVVGGAKETDYACNGKYCLVLRNRKGFIRLALKNGSPIIPVFSFGETSLFNRVICAKDTLYSKFQAWAKKKTGVPFNIFYGRGFFQYTFGIIPFRHPINVVVGRPIEVEKNENPTKEDIDVLHQKFMETLINLFDEYKYRFEENPKTTCLVLI